MSAYKISDSDFVTLMDSYTGRQILNIDRNLIEYDDHVRSKRFCCVARKHINCQTLHDSFCEPTPARIKKVALEILSHAFNIAMELSDGWECFVYCKNARSRSPAVIAAFYIVFRGRKYDDVKAWLDVAYKTQRPITANASVDFPNFPKFELPLRYCFPSSS